jgi:hypothetical protein
LEKLSLCEFPTAMREDVAAIPGDGTRIRNVNKVSNLYTDDKNIHSEKRVNSL